MTDSCFIEFETTQLLPRHSAAVAVVSVILAHTPAAMSLVLLFVWLATIRTLFFPLLNGVVGGHMPAVSDSLSV